MKGLPSHIRAILTEKDIVKKAYLLGYFLGYHGHTDWVGVWRELRESLFESAEEIGVLRKAIRAYQRGKREGAHDRELAIIQGLYSPPLREEIENVIREIQKTGVPTQSRVPKILRVRLTGEAKMLLRSGVLDQIKILRLPRFLGRR